MTEMTGLRRSRGELDGGGEGISGVEVLEEALMCRTLLYFANTRCIFQCWGLKSHGVSCCAIFCRSTVDFAVTCCVAVYCKVHKTVLE